MSKQSFVLYTDIRLPLGLLDDCERGKLFSALLDYAEFGTEPDFGGALQMAFAFIRNSLDRDAAQWEQKREKRAEAGRKGGQARARAAAEQIQENYTEVQCEDAEAVLREEEAKQANASFARGTQQREAVQANQAVPVPVPVPVPAPAPVPVPAPEKKRESKRESSAARFTPPTAEEVDGYCREAGITVDAGRFVDFYASKGWRVGREGMKDWKAAVRNWERRENCERGNHSGTGLNAEKADPRIRVRTA